MPGAPGQRTNTSENTDGEWLGKTPADLLRVQPTPALPLLTTSFLHFLGGFVWVLLLVVCFLVVVVFSFPHKTSVLHAYMGHELQE